LDLENNLISDPEILDILKQLPKLGVLNLQRNPIRNNVENYRRRLISELLSLKYLDDKPVFPNERRAIMAW
jgi:dynein assembly factor 1